MKNAAKHQNLRKARILRAAILGTLLVGAQAQGASPFPQVPIGSGDSNAIAPNIIFLLDDSGSMQWEWIGSGSQNLAGFTYGYPAGDSIVYGSNNYQDVIPGFGTGGSNGTISNNDIYADQFRSAAINPIYYNPAITYYPWACAAPYPESSGSSGVTAPQTNLSCSWNAQLGLWLMQNANPAQAYLNPANQNAGYRDLQVWNSSGNSQNSTAGNGYMGNSSTLWYTANGGYFGAYQSGNTTTQQCYTNRRGKTSCYNTNIPIYGLWPATYFNFFQGNINNTNDVNNTANYQPVQICPPNAPSIPLVDQNGNPITDSNGNPQYLSQAVCIPPPVLPSSPTPGETYLATSGNYSEPTGTAITCTTSNPCYVYVTPAGDQIVRTYTDEMQNFANWYQYARSHILLAQDGTSQAFSQLPENFRVDFATINNIINGTFQYSPTVHRFTLTQRTEFLSNLFQTPIPPQGTPSRLALAAVGNWLEGSPSSTSAPWGPSDQEITNYGDHVFSCRQNYTVFVTDGGWNGAGPNVGNADGTAGPTINGANNQSYTYNPTAPYQDSYKNTLADVAFYYWEHDLQSNLINDVPTNVSDPAFWQHMVTFTVGLGVQGTLPYPNSFAGLQSGALQWPAPCSGFTTSGTCGGNSAGLIDDLWHAAIDGHGQYLSASDPQTYASALANTLQNIQTRTQSTSSVAVTGTQLAQNSIAYVPSYTSGVWTGDVQAYLYNPSTSKFNTTAAWSAQKNISAQGSSRSIFTMGSSGAVAFQPANLSTAQSTALTNPAYVSGATIAQVVANISGDTSQDNILFRNRPIRTPALAVLRSGAILLPMSPSGIGKMTSSLACPATSRPIPRTRPSGSTW